MTSYSVPYGKTNLTFDIPDHFQVDVIAPTAHPPAGDPARAVADALANPLGGVSLSDFTGASAVAIAINDKTRPVPLGDLLPPLLRELERLGVHAENVTLLIATGSHSPMPPEEYPQVVPPDILDRYSVSCHDCDDRANLVYLGSTPRHTPVWVIRKYHQAALRIVVGNIEPHQFQGFSGGVKGAAIGLAGRETINHNHAMMMDTDSRLGEYESNPARQDVEDIGDIIGVHFALNAILNDKKQIVRVVAGEPRAVMRMGIPLVRQICQVPVSTLYDLMVVSPGGHPKDINLYQSQKGLAHAALIIREGGTIILAAPCPEGTGSQKYEEWVLTMRSTEEVFDRFRREGFRIGPHKAYQIARDASRAHLFLISDMDTDFVERLLITPAADIPSILAARLPDLPPHARIGIMPWANATIPVI